MKWYLLYTENIFIPEPQIKALIHFKPEFRINRRITRRTMLDSC